MNSYLLLIGFATLLSYNQGHATQDAAGKKDCYINLEGADRHFIVYQPAKVTGKKVPVVFMFHGTSGNGEKFYKISGWKEKADREGFIAVFPSALRYCVEDKGKVVNTTKWSDGKLVRVACEGQALRDDVLFFREMVKYLKANYDIDGSRIYASGFSNGANFVSRLTLEASDILAATAMSAGYLQDTSFVAKELIPSFLTIGNMEEKLQNDGKPLAVNINAIENPDLNALVLRMLNKLQLKSDYTYEQKPRMVLYRFDKNTGDGKNIFQFAVIDSLPHRYPNGTNHPLVMADIFWDYFLQFKK
jgi:poly(3-hydroxybutyrate) depolymerase